MTSAEVPQVQMSREEAGQFYLEKLVELYPDDEVLISRAIEMDPETMRRIMPNLDEERFEPTDVIISEPSRLQRFSQATLTVLGFRRR